MSAGFIVLIVLIFILMCGAGQRVLDRMRMNDKWALATIIAIIIGLLIPPIKIEEYFQFSIGGFLIPFAVCVYLFVKVGWSTDLLRAVAGIVAVGVINLGLWYILPADPEELWFEPSYLYGITSGIVAYLLGKSRRNAFICSVIGLSLAMLLQRIINNSLGTPTLLSLGCGGGFDAIIISIIISVALVEIFGESLEKLTGEKHKKTRKLEDGSFVKKNKKLNKEVEK